MCTVLLFQLSNDTFMKVSRSAAVYYLLQGLAVFGWWLILWLQPQFRDYFSLEAGSQLSLLAFWLPDILLLGAGSLCTAHFCFRESPYRHVSAWFVTGAMSYGALYCLAFTLMTDRGWLGVTLMLPAMLWSGVFAVGMSFSTKMFRPAAYSSSNWVVAKTVTQIVVVWTVILAIFPHLITLLEDKLGIDRLQFAFHRPVAVCLFVLISSVGVWAALVMSKTGLGTPLPLDHARRLVVRGPYAYVRNPMAVSGIGQGLAVALFFGSPLVVAYAIMGSLIWQIIFRPLEEEDLLRRFGRQYEDYRRQVKCWVPRFNAYQIDGTPDSSNSLASPLGRM